MFRGETIAIDAMGWLHRASYTCALELALNFPTDRFLYTIMGFLKTVLAAGIKPVLVFDGASPPLKSDESSRRQELRQDAVRRGIEVLEENADVVKASEQFQRAISVDSFMIKQFQALLRRESIPFIVAPYEADAQIALLYARKVVTAAISEDSDLLALGVRRLITKLDKNGDATLVDLRPETLAKFLPFGIVRLPTREDWERHRREHRGWCRTGMESKAAAAVTASLTRRYSSSPSDLKQQDAPPQPLPDKVVVGGDLAPATRAENGNEESNPTMDRATASSDVMSPGDQANLSCVDDLSLDIGSSSLPLGRAPASSPTSSTTLTTPIAYKHDKKIDAFEVLLRRRKSPSSPATLAQTSGASNSNAATTGSPADDSASPSASIAVTPPAKESKSLKPTLISNFFQKLSPGQSKPSGEIIMASETDSIEESPHSSTPIKEVSILDDDDINDDEITSFTQMPGPSRPSRPPALSRSSNSNQSFLDGLDWNIDLDQVMKDASTNEVPSLLECKHSTAELYERFTAMQRAEYSNAHSNDGMAQTWTTTVSPVNGHPLSQADYEFILTIASLAPYQFLELCILAGCDYLPSLPRIGIKTAAKMLRKFMCTDCLIHQLTSPSRSNSSPSSPGFGRGNDVDPVLSTYHGLFHRARLAFWHQIVYDPESKRFVYLSPPPRSLLQRFPHSPDSEPGALNTPNSGGDMVFPSQLLVPLSEATEIFERAVRQMGRDPEAEPMVQHMRTLAKQGSGAKFVPMEAPSSSERLDTYDTKALNKTIRRCFHRHVGTFGLVEGYGEVSLEDLANISLQCACGSQQLEDEMTNPCPAHGTLDMCFAGYPLPDEIAPLIAEGDVSARTLRRLLPVEDEQQQLLELFRASLREPDSYTAEAVKQMWKLRICTPALAEAAHGIVELEGYVPSAFGSDSSMAPGRTLTEGSMRLMYNQTSTGVRSGLGIKSSRDAVELALEVQQESAQQKMTAFVDSLLNGAEFSTFVQESFDTAAEQAVSVSNRPEANEVSPIRPKLSIKEESKPEFVIDAKALRASSIPDSSPSEMQELEPWVELLCGLVGAPEFGEHNDAPEMELGQKRKSVIEHEPKRKSASLFTSLAKGFSAEASDSNVQQHVTSSATATVGAALPFISSTSIMTGGTKLIAASGLSGVQTILTFKTTEATQPRPNSLAATGDVSPPRSQSGTATATKVEPKQKRLTSSLKAAFDSNQKDTSRDLFGADDDSRKDKKKISSLFGSRGSSSSGGAGAFISVDNPFAPIDALFDAPTKSSSSSTTATSKVSKAPVPEFGFSPPRRKAH